MTQHLVGATPGTMTGIVRNLLVTRIASNQVRVQGAEAVLISKFGSGVIRHRASFNVTASLATSGAGGLDTGSATASKLYYIWLISNGTTIAALLSTSSSSPTMPGGYGFRSLVSGMYFSSGSSFVPATQEGSQYNYITGQTLVIGNVGLGAWVSISTSQFVFSAISTQPYGNHNFYIGAGMTNNNADSPTLGTYPQNTLHNAGAAAQQAFWEMALLTANTLYWQSAAADQKIVINGFRINKNVLC